MKTIFLAIMSLLIATNCLATQDTLYKKQWKGFLFISAYNAYYDNDGHEIKKFGFSDYFFPSNCIKLQNLNDSVGKFNLKEGIRVNFFEKRNEFKNLAKDFSCTDTSGCYSYENFYIIPIILEGKLYEDDWPLTCHRNFYELQVAKGAKVRFEYLHKAMIPTRVTAITAKPK